MTNESAADFAITITIFFSIGSVNIQRQRRCMDIWLHDHYPSLNEQYRSRSAVKDKEGVPAVPAVPTPPRAEKSEAPTAVVTSSSDVKENVSAVVTTPHHVKAVVEDENNNTVVPPHLLLTPNRTASPQQKMKQFFRNNKNSLIKNRLCTTSPSIVKSTTPEMVETQLQSTSPKGDSTMMVLQKHADRVANPQPTECASFDVDAQQHTSPQGDSTCDDQSTQTNRVANPQAEDSNLKEANQSNQKESEEDPNRPIIKSAGKKSTSLKGECTSAIKNDVDRTKKAEDGNAKKVAQKHISNN